ncbi:MAG: metal-dependent hydrolase [Bacteroidota bacterium]
MDSLTQIVLGAAVGEVVLGKKIGNRAMVWGAIAGTIPDLDIFANFATDNISATAFHRGITHSVPFAVIAPFALGWILHQIYSDRPKNDKRWWRDFSLLYLFFIILTSIGTLVLPIPFSDVLPIALIVSASILFFLLVSFAFRAWRKSPALENNPSWYAWGMLFFWSIFTHPLLDSCTAYGTQLFQPFSDFRVNLNNISVADPIYTIPFLICLIIASILTRNSRRRAIFNWLGIGLSSAYLVFTAYNKVKTDRIFEFSLRKQQIDYERFTNSPTIFNNILWQGVAETDTCYYQGRYSLLDTEPEIKKFHYLPKNHELIASYKDQREIRILDWFSDGYYNITKRADGIYQFNNLKYGTISENPEVNPQYVFSFLFKEEDGKLVELPQEFVRDSAAFEYLIERLKGVE